MTNSEELRSLEVISTFFSSTYSEVTSNNMDCIKDFGRITCVFQISTQIPKLNRNHEKK